MRKQLSQLTRAALLVAISLACGTVDDAAAEVNVSVNLGPPPVVVQQPPELVLVPQSDVYFVPDYNFDLFYYGGYWWSPRGDRWYRARAYNGPWRIVSRRVIPPPVYRVPRDYRRVYLGERRIPYGQWNREWRDHDRGRRGGREFREHRGEERWEHERGEHRER
jgi:hypothetical protein